MPGFFGYLFLASIFTMGGFIHFSILMFRRVQTASRYGVPEVFSFAVTYAVSQALFTALTIDAKFSIVVAAYLAMPVASLVWWWLIIRQFRTSHAFSQSVACILPVFYVPFLFLMPMLGGAMGNWPYGTLARGIADDFSLVWVIGFAILHVLSIVFVIITWLSTSADATESADSHSSALDYDLTPSDNPYAPPVSR